MNIWDIGIWALVSFCFVACFAIVVTAANWFFVIGLLVSTLFALYLLGQA